MSTTEPCITIEQHGWGETHTDIASQRCVMIQRDLFRERGAEPRFSLELLAMEKRQGSDSTAYRCLDVRYAFSIERARRLAGEWLAAPSPAPLAAAS